MFSAIYAAGADTFWVFALITVVLGGLSAWATGRAIALTWRPYLQLVGYTFLLAGAARFFQHALFQKEFLSLPAFAIDFALLLAIALAGYRWTRAAQMSAQYPWVVGREK